MPIRAVLFDLDGTLLDTLADIATGTNQALRELGLSEHPVEAYKRFVGSGIDELAKRALGSHFSTERAAFVVEIARTRMATNEHARPYNGIEELLESLRGCRLAVLSNKPHVLVVPTVERFFPDIPFEQVVGQREGIPEKPDPASALQILETLQVDSGEAIFLGDSDIDIMTARNAEMIAVGAAWGFRGRAELEQAGAHAVIEHPGELVGMVTDGTQSAPV